MSNLAKAGCFLLLLATVACAIAWFWSASRHSPGADPILPAASELVPSAHAPSLPEQERSPVRHSEVPPDTPSNVAEDIQASRSQDIEAIKRDCPWPPDPSTWWALNQTCMSTMSRIKVDRDWRWKWILEEPVAARQAVVEALDIPECRLPPLGDRDEDVPWREWPRWRGEPLPELYEACGVEAMLQLAELQSKCIERLGVDWDQIYVERRDQVSRFAQDQDEYFHWMEQDDRARASTYWEVLVCRSVPPEALEWVDALPEPVGDPRDDRGTRQPITQALDLYDTARRLGAGTAIPTWALPPTAPVDPPAPPVDEEDGAVYTH